MRGFTMVEIAIVATLAVVISTSTIMLTDPVEKVKSTGDAATIQYISELRTTLVNAQINVPSLFSQQTIEGKSLMDQGITTLFEELEKRRYMSHSFLARKEQREQIFLTMKPDLSYLSFCFIPKSKQLKGNPQTHMNSMGGIKMDCVQSPCYYCVYGISGEGGGDYASKCADFDPIHPQLPWTSNSILPHDPNNAMLGFGCTNFTSIDYGCNSSYCPTGQRALFKSYNGSYACLEGFLNLLYSVNPGAREIYCASPEKSNCEEYNYQSSPANLLHGCLNPVRPVDWMPVGEYFIGGENELYEE